MISLTEFAFPSKECTTPVVNQRVSSLYTFIKIAYYLGLFLRTISTKSSWAALLCKNIGNFVPSADIRFSGWGKTRSLIIV